MSVLTVYKASAGSGKTFQLTSEYLKIIFRNPEDFKSILAVTFTHKATAEMKARILKELHSLSQGKESQISNILCEELGCSNADIFNKASTILKKILHHYSHFHISTIDSFFQGIISSFARDLGLQANFSVELNSSKVLNAVVDDLLLNIEKDPLLARWLIEFAEEKVSRGESWELKQEIKNLGNELFREDYAYGHLKNTSRDLIVKFRNDINRLKKEKENRLEEIVKNAQNEIKSAGLSVEDFSFGLGGAAGFLLKLRENPLKRPGSRVNDALQSAEKWANKKAVNREIIIEVAGRSLINLLKEGIEVSYDYLNLQLLSSNIYTLGVLSDLQSSISEYARDHNLFMLDQSPWLINMLMDSNDAPFIYEKAGNRFQHFMIDEFQDTSSLQWDNFYPLIMNSLAQGKDCMVVGDVKQSIYRWRNSNWSTLASLNEGQNYIKVRQLDTNWRSRPLLVKFNNSLFTLASYKLQEQFDKAYSESNREANPYSELIPSAYEGLTQNIPLNPNDNSGYVAVKFIEKEEKPDKEDESEEIKKTDEALSETLKFIDRLLASGYHMKDIAVLVRNKREGTRVAEFLVNQKPEFEESYRVISNDALYLEKSSTVKLIIAVMQWMLDDTDKVNNLFLVSELAQPSAGSVFPGYFGSDMANSFLPPFLVESRDRMSVLPLFDLVEFIVYLFRLAQEEGQYPYLQAFIDIVHDFCTRESGSVPEFIEWWKENSLQFTINAPEEQDAIRIITIHKAKGLEFKAVIIPFCNWNIDHTPPHMPILWCKTEGTEFSELGRVPVRYHSNLAGSAFAGAYYTEKIQSFVDNLNLLYVAFTRAKDCLYVICDLNGRTKRIGSLVKDVFFDGNGQERIDNLNSLGLQNFIQSSTTAQGIIEFGQIPLIASSDKKPAVKGQTGSTSLPGNRIHIRAHNEEYFLPLLDPEREGKINRGLIIHQALSEINSIEDINSSLQKINSGGQISSSEIKEIADEIKKMVEDPLVKSWFSPEWEVKKEAGIIERSEGLQRPDRIMINGTKAIVVDYKTGGKENKKYRYQLARYMDSLKKMGYTDVKAYIWYLRLGKVEEVKAKE